MLAALELHGCRPRQSGDGWTFFCLVHGDGKSPAGTLAQGDVAALVLCHAACDTELVVVALGLTMADLFDDRTGGGERWEKGAVYVYGPPDHPIARKTRWRKPDGTSVQSWQRYEGGRWAPGLDGQDPGLYRAAELVDAKEVWICEGESDAEAVRSLGVIATSPPHGAGPGKWKPDYTATLAATGAQLILCRDRDDIGRSYASGVYGHLGVAGCAVRLVEPLVGKDVRDHLSAGHTLAELVVVAQTATPVSATGLRPPPGPDGVPPDDVPRLDPRIVEGHLLGQLAQVVADGTGVSLSAPWATICALVGTWIGRGPTVALAGEHHCHDYVALVADSGTGKGYSWWATRQLIGPVLGDWIDERVAGGINSGEFLIDRLAEEGDTRLLVYEEELSRLTTVANRGGSTVSQVLRALWDSPPRVATGARTKKAMAQDPHVGLVVHATPADLAETITATDLRNGVAGRILWTWVMGDRFDPFGPPRRWAEGHNSLLSQLAEVGAQARASGDVALSPEAHGLWAIEARRLREAARGHPDPLDALLARASSHVARTAMLLAITDTRLPAPRRTVGVEHLRMALAWWDTFQLPSALYVWGQAGVVTSTRAAQREREADTADTSNFLRRALRVYDATLAIAPAGLNWQGQRKALANRTNALELQAIREYLVKKGLCRVEERQGSHGKKEILLFAI